MRNRNKKLLSAVIALVMAASVAVSVSAADYEEDPGYADTPSQSGSTTSDEIRDVITDLGGNEIGGGGSSGGSSGGTTAAEVEKEAEKNPDVIEDAVTSSDDDIAKIEVKSTKNLVLTPSVLKDLVKKKATLEIVSPTVTLSIDPSTITKASKLDLSTSISTKKTKTKIKIGKNKKAFGCEVKITVTSNRMPKWKLEKANVYCNGKKVGPVELDAKGYPVITATEAGVYEIR